jgi:ATP-dependent Clp protease, protease subunit
MRNEFFMADEEEKPPKKEGPSSFESIEIKLLESRTILVEGPVTDKMYRAVVARLLYLEQKDGKADINMFINSPGGSADSGFGIYDAARFVSCPVRTVVAGLCASAAVLIHLSGTKGKRFMLPNSRFLLHQPSTSTGMAQASDMEITAREILRTRQKYAEICAQEIGSTAAKIQEDSNRDFWLNAEESKKYGLVDKIVKSRNEL